MQDPFAATASCSKESLVLLEDLVAALMKVAEASAKHVLYLQDSSSESEQTNNGHVRKPALKSKPLFGGTPYNFSVGADNTSSSPSSNNMSRAHSLRRMKNMFSRHGGKPYATLASSRDSSDAIIRDEPTAKSDKDDHEAQPIPADNGGG